MGQIDGSIVPCAAGGSIPFLPQETIGVLKNVRENHTEQSWSRYGLWHLNILLWLVAFCVTHKYDWFSGFVDAFNPLTNWTNPDVIGIDVGITLLMAENYRTGFVWNHFMANPQIQLGMNKIGFVPYKKSIIGPKKLAKYWLNKFSSNKVMSWNNLNTGNFTKNK